MQSFKSWTEVLTHAEEHKRDLYYHAPMDVSPRLINYVKTGDRIRVQPLTSDASPFWADAKHVDRFRKR